MNPFISFCVYVAARVFVQYLKTRSKDQQMNSSLQFLLQAMQALRRKNPLTESFLVQLDLDLEGAGIQKPYMPVDTRNCVVPVNTDPVGCSSIYEIRETQAQNAPINQFANSRTSSSNAAPRFSQDSGQQPPAFGTSNGNGIEIAPQPAPFAPIRNLQDVSQDFSPHRSAVPGGTTFIFDSNPNDMDLSGDQPSPSTINSQSRGGSTSQSSYSPGQQTDLHLPYRASPRFTSSMPPALHPSSTTAPPALGSLPYAASAADVPMTAFPDEAINNGQFDNSYDWEFAAMSGGMGPEMGLPQDLEAGLTPGAWNSMLESVMGSASLGWDAMGQGGGNEHVSGAARN